MEFERDEMSFSLRGKCGVIMAKDVSNVRLSRRNVTRYTKGM